MSERLYNDRENGIIYRLDTINKRAIVSKCISNLTYMEIPESKIVDLGEKQEKYKIDTIDDGAFENCAGLITVVISGIKHIGVKAFYKCTSLREVITKNSNIEICNSAFEDCISLYKFLTAEKYTKKEKSDYSYIRSDSIGENAFKNCKSLQNVIFLSSDIEIYSHAFDGCENISKIEFKTVKQLGEAVFCNCSKLENIDINGCITSIPKNTFKNCLKLEECHIKGKVVMIDDNAFSRCKKLETVEFDNKIERIGENSFSKCRKLKKFTSNNENAIKYVNYVGDYAFNDCRKLEGLNEMSELMECFPKSFPPIKVDETFKLGNPECLQHIEIKRKNRTFKNIANVKHNPKTFAGLSSLYFIIASILGIIGSFMYFSEKIGIIFSGYCIHITAIIILLVYFRKTSKIADSVILLLIGFVGLLFFLIIYNILPEQLQNNVVISGILLGVISVSFIIGVFGTVKLLINSIKQLYAAGKDISDKIKDALLNKQSKVSVFITVMTFVVNQIFKFRLNFEHGTKIDIFEQIKELILKIFESK